MQVFLHTISYNNMSRPPAAPRLLVQNLGVATTNPPELTLPRMSMLDAALWTPNHNVIFQLQASLRFVSLFNV